MSIGTAIAGVAVVGGALYLTRPARQDRSTIDNYLYRLSLARRRAWKGECGMARLALESAEMDRTLLIHRGEYSRDFLEPHREAQREVDGCTRTGLRGLGVDEAEPTRLTAKSAKERVQRRYLAKKFWGSAVLAAQSAASMSILSTRTNWFSKQASDEAKALAEEATQLSNRASTLANKYDQEWVAYWGREHTSHSGNART